VEVLTLHEHSCAQRLRTFSAAEAGIDDLVGEAQQKLELATFVPDVLDQVPILTKVTNIDLQIDAPARWLSVYCRCISLTVRTRP
jgi:hypothetical protein